MLTIDKRDITATELGSGGEIRCKLGDAATGDGVIPDGCFWGIDGFVSRPLDKNADGACQALFMVEGNTRRIIGLKDNRINSKYGDLQPGDKAIFTAGSARILVKNTGDSVNMVTEASDGTTCMTQLTGGDSPAFSSVIGDGTNSTYIKQTASSITLGVSGGTMLVIDANGLHVTGPLAELNTGRVCLAMTALNVPLVDGVNNVVLGLIGSTGVGSTKVYAAS